VQVGSCFHIGVVVVVVVIISSVVVVVVVRTRTVPVNGIARQGQTHTLGRHAQLVRLARVGSKEKQRSDVVIAIVAAGWLLLQMSQSGRKESRLGKIASSSSIVRSIRSLVVSYQIPRLAPPPHQVAANPALRFLLLLF